MPGDYCMRFIRSHADSEHGAISSCTFIHEAPAQHDDLRGLIQRKNASDTSGGDFAHAVTNDGGRINAPRLPKRRKCHLHGENRRLRYFRALHLRFGLRTVQFIHKRELGPWTHGLVAGLDHAFEDRLMLHEFAAHTLPLRALTTHDEDESCRFFSAWRKSRAHARTGLTSREGTEFLHHFAKGARSEGQTMRVVIPPSTEHISKVRKQW